MTWSTRKTPAGCSQCPTKVRWSSSPAIPLSSRSPICEGSNKNELKKGGGGGVFTVCNEWLFLDCMQNTVTKLPIFDFQFLNAYNLIESLIIVPLIYIFIDSSDVWMCSGDIKKYIRNRQNEFIINQLRRIVNSSWWINTSFWLIINSLWWIINTFRWITISFRCFQFYFFISLTSFRSVESWIL